jgi:hypothetical protein
VIRRLLPLSLRARWPRPHLLSLDKNVIRTWTSIFIVAALWTVASVSIQARIPETRGVVWQVPDDFELAREDLMRMRAMGVTAVRTGVIEDERLLRVADLLGLEFYQEVGGAYHTVSALRDTLEGTRVQLRRAAAFGHRYASARTFGVARYADTSSPETCQMIRELVDDARTHGPADTRAYYVSVFIEEDVCAGEVDFVLLNARDHEYPLSVVERWRAAHDTPVGLAALGRWVIPGGRAGLRNPHSFASQARYLEDALNEMHMSTLRLEAVFVYRWRDAETTLPAFHRADRDPYRATYGLIGERRGARPAAEVVSGFYTGTRYAFAFEQGEAGYRTWPWPTMMMWTVLLLIGLTYAISIRFRHTVPRYFVTHGFYRDSVREGRNLLLGSSFTILIAFSIAAGTALFVAIDVLGQATGFRMLALWLPDALIRFWGGASVNPLIFILLAAAVFAALKLFWIVVLALLSRAAVALGPGQAMLLAIWPQWTILLVMIFMVGLSVTDLWSVPVEPVLFVGGLWAITAIWAVLRTVVDFAIIARAPAFIPIVAFLLHPFVLFLAGLAFTAMVYQEELRFVAQVMGVR